MITKRSGTYPGKRRVGFLWKNMSDLDKFNYECPGQLSLFDGLLKEMCDTKPDIGTNLIFHYKNKDYACVVDGHCGHDFFHIVFTDRQPSDDYLDVENSGGWHVSLRGYKKDWDYVEVLP